MKKVILFLAILSLITLISEQNPAHADKTLIVGVPKEPHRLDGRTNSVASRYFAPSLLEVLGWIDFDLKVSPQLAESWEISKDCKKYIFHLKKGIKFHSGQPFNAEAVKLNIEGALGLLKNWEPTKEPAMIEMVENIKVLDNHTVEVNLKIPSIEFLLGGASYNILSIVCPASAEKYGKVDYGMKYLAGTGPFKWGEWVRGDKVVFLRNQDYWGSRTGNVDKIIFKIIPDDQSRLMALEKGEIDIDPDIPSHEIERLSSRPDISVHMTEGTRTMYFVLNTVKGPTSDKKVRRALMHAVNIDEIVKKVVGPIGTPPTGLVSTKVFGNLDVYKKLVPKYDPMKAKMLLAEAGWKDTNGDGLLDKNGKNMEITIVAPNNRAPKDRECAEAIHNQFRKIGIDAKLEIVEWAYFITGMKNRSLDACVYAWMCVTGDISYIYGNFLEAKSSWNAGGYNNPRVEKLIKLGREEPDSKKREKLHYEVAKIIIEDGLMMPLFHENVTVATRRNIKGFKPHPSGRMFLHNVVVE